MENKINDIKTNLALFYKSIFQVLPVFVKYQIITKFIFSIVIAPILFIIINQYVSSRTNSVLDMTVLITIIKDPKGIILLIFLILTIIISLLVEIIGLILISHYFITENKKISYVKLIIINTKRILIGMLKPQGILIILITLFAVPLSGNSFGISIFDSIKMPSFVINEMEVNSQIFITIGGLSILSLIIILLSTFGYHFIALSRTKKYFTNSFLLIKRNFIYFVKFHIKAILLILLPVSLIIAAISALTEGIINIINLDNSLYKIIALSLLIIQKLITMSIALLIIPIWMHLMTILFNELVKRNNQQEKLIPMNILEEKTKTQNKKINKILSKKKTITTIVLVILLISANLLSLHIDKSIDDSSKKLLTVSHRAGGNKFPENSISGLEYAIRIQASFTEIDIQRTKDNHYILNHDNNFKRTTGEGKSSQDMNLEEIKQLKFKNSNETIPTLEQILDISKDKIKVLIELKGVTADKKMADDIIAMIKNKNIENQTVLVSGNNNLLDYIKQKDSSINTGLVYFLPIINLKNITADYILLEKDQINDFLIAEAHSLNKKVMVWTINDPEVVNNLKNLNADGIITDEPKAIIDAIKSQVTRKNLLFNILSQS